MADRKVYVVDDEESIRRALDFMLRFKGFAVTLFDSGPALLEVADALIPGCVLLDVRMPEMDGLEVQRELRRRGAAHSVVLMTGHGDFQVAIEALQNGAVGFVEKPFAQSVILKAIGTAFLKLDDPEGYDAYRAEAAAAIRRLEGEDRDLLAALTRGRSTDEIAGDLGIPTAAVEIRRARLFRALDVENANDAVRLAFAGADTGSGRG